jgi:ERCC4-type nuclease
MERREMSMSILSVDSREPSDVKNKFLSMAKIHKDLEIEVKALKTGDFENEVMIIESKTIDDFISSFTTSKTRKDGSEYERLESQIKRMLKLNKPRKILLIHGNLKDCYSNIHPAAVRGMISKIVALGIIVLWVTEEENWHDLIYRLHKKTIKYLVSEVSK